MENKTTLRPITPEDQDLLYRIYASTRQEELESVGWDESQKEEFLKMQFNAQHTYYMEQFPDAEFQIILMKDEPIGRLYIDRRKDEIRLVDIALLPEHRGKGIGSYYMNDILAQGQKAGLPVRIHVERNNPAMRLYQRLGFQNISDTGVYFLMEWTPINKVTK